MLKRLQRQLLLIIMTLVGTVLVAVLGSTYLATYRTQESLIQNSLDRTLYGGMTDRLTMGEHPRDDNRMGGMLGLLVEVSSDGIVLEVSDTPVVVNTDALTSVIKRVLEDGEESGRDRSIHLAWTSAQFDEDAYDVDDDDEDDDDGYDDESSFWHIALVDTTPSDTLLHEQAIHDLQIICFALIALFAISWWLSDWALRPVARAWEQQRRFVADASHELKTPLAVILANTQILQRDETLPEDARRWVDSTADEATHMKALVGDLLQLARADETAAGVATNAMRHEDINLSEMVEAAALEFDALAFERGLTLEEDISENLHITGDPEWVDRLVRILIDNACKYGATGTSVKVSLSASSGKTHLVVHNWGNPIDPEDLPHVFERFYRSDKARQREGEGGFGLGLAIAKGIADAHGGAISVASTESDGTTFSVVL